MPNELLADLGRLFFGLRKERGLTQREAARLAESTQARVSYLEAGETDLMVTTIQRWADVYDCDVEIHLVSRQAKFNQALVDAMAEDEGD